MAGLSLGVPLLTSGIYALSQRFSWGPREVSLDRIFVLSLIFSGFPAFVTAGGVARLVAHRIAERPERGLGWAVARAASAMGLAGIGLALICAVPLGVLPEQPKYWWPLAIVGAAAGSVTGIAVAILAGMRQRRRAAA